MIHVSCPSCGKALKGPDHEVGQAISCPGCGQQQSIPTMPTENDDLPWALEMPEAEESGPTPTPDPASEQQSTGGYPLVVSSKRVRLLGLPAGAFQHPLDRQATNSLKKLKGFDWVVKKILHYGVERIDYLRNMGSSIRVGPGQLPRLYEMLREACWVLDTPEPELYVRQGGVNASTFGHEKPYVVLQTQLLDVMDEVEVMAVLAHELGHIKCGHVLYMAMARWIGPLFEQIGEASLGLANLAGLGLAGGVIQQALLVWFRRAEYSADRAAVLALQDERPCLSMLMKLAAGSKRHGSDLNLDQFRNQARAYHDGLDKSMADRFYRLIAYWDRDHPATVERAHAVDGWFASQQYNKVLQRDYSAGAVLPPAPIACPVCGKQISAGSKFCGQCHTPIWKK